MRSLLTIILLLISISTFSQENIKEKKIDSLMQELVKEQSGNNEFAAGVFPSYRIQSKGKARFADDNIFFSAIIAMRLMRHKHNMPAVCTKKAKTIIHNVQKASEAYKNKYDRVSYNFWQTNPVKQFPGDAKLTKKTRYHIPDDADDSAILFLVNDKTSEQMLALKKMMEENIPGKKRKINNTLPPFKTLPAYSTWLGDRMPPEFDFCVMTNILYVFSEYKLSYTQHDWATITFIRESLVDGFLKEKAYRVSPQYKSESACLYHLAFLVSAYSIPGLDEIKPQLITRLFEKLPNAPTKGEAMLLVSALKYLGQTLPSNYQLPNNTDEFPFFYANLASVTPNPFNACVSKSSTFNYPYQCKAWNIMLELEILLMSK